jgi:hypothetical protein
MQGFLALVRTSHRNKAEAHKWETLNNWSPKDFHRRKEQKKSAPKVSSK